VEFAIMSLLAAVMALVFAAHILVGILKSKTGTDEMQRIALYIQEGSEGFFIA